MTFGKAFSAEQESEQSGLRNEWEFRNGDGKPETFSGNLVRKQDGESLKEKHSKWGDF